MDPPEPSNNEPLVEESEEVPHQATDGDDAIVSGSPGGPEEVYHIVLEADDGSETVADAVQTQDGKLRLITAPAAVTQQQAANEGTMEEAEEDVMEKGDQQGTEIQQEAPTEEGITTYIAIAEEGHEEGVTVATAGADGVAVVQMEADEEEQAAHKTDVTMQNATLQVLAEIAPPPAADANLGEDQEMTAVAVEDPIDSAPVVPQYILQSPPTYKMDMLQDMFALQPDCLLDLAVFCRDGVAWTSKLLMAAVSPFFRELLQQVAIDTPDQPCIIVPELTKVEFMTFHRALFAKEDDTSMDFFVLIKVAEILCCELSLTTTFPTNEGPFPTVDYQSTFKNRDDKRRVLYSLGFDPEGTHVSTASTSGVEAVSSHTTLTKLSNVFRTEVPCDVCGRSFVDEIGLQKHRALLHDVQKPFPQIVKNYNAYHCPHCSRAFSFAVNLRKHIWLSHGKKPTPPAGHASHPAQVAAAAAAASAAAVNRPIDPVETKAQRQREKIEDMRCTVCGLEATSWKQLQMHMMDHTQERPYKCETCGKGFKEPQKLKRHLVSHTGERNHKCSFCGKGFGLRHNMRQHEKIHLGQGYTCHYCGKVFSQVTNMRDHEAVHADKGHVQSTDPEVQKSQAFAKIKGRPSIKELDKKSKSASGSAKVGGARKGMIQVSESIDKFMEEAEAEEEEESGKADETGGEEKSIAARAKRTMAKST